jgi:hypothetical protein
MPVMPLFTVILEFDGGTYVAQVRAQSERVALAKYASQLVTNAGVPNARLRRRLASELGEDEPVPVEGVQNVWCVFASIGSKSALANIVQTAD